MEDIRFEIKIGKIIVRVKKGDLTKEKVDAIVNAANEHLMHGGGLAGAIVRAGGKQIQEESNKIAPVPTGSAKATGAGSLSCKRVIHAVGPIWSKYSPEEAKHLLSSAVLSSLQIANQEGLDSISIPAISSGIFGFPKQLCAEVILETIFKFIKENKKNSLLEINLCNFDEQTVQIFTDEIKAKSGDLIK